MATQDKATSGTPSRATASAQPSEGTPNATAGAGSAAMPNVSDVERRVSVADESRKSQAPQANVTAGQSRAGPPLAGRQVQLWRGGVLTPWELLRQMSSDLDRLLATFATPALAAAPVTERSLSSRVDTTADSNGAPLMPKVEVLQRPNQLVVRADLPGLDPAEVDVTVEDGMLVISGERRQEHREARDGVARSEIRYGAFRRTVPLPQGADEEHVSATFRNGVLEVNVPVPQREEARRIRVTT